MCVMLFAFVLVENVVGEMRVDLVEWETTDEQQGCDVYAKNWEDEWVMWCCLFDWGMDGIWQQNVVDEWKNGGKVEVVLVFFVQIDY